MLFEYAFCICASRIIPSTYMLVWNEVDATANKFDATAAYCCWTAWYGHSGVFVACPLCDKAITNLARVAERSQTDQRLLVADTQRRCCSMGNGAHWFPS